jgi:signal transduction histidine kinase
VGQLALSPMPIEIVALVRQVVSTMGGQAWRQGKVQVALETSDSEVWGIADSQRLAQVLVSLLHDAVRHTLPGGVVAVNVKNQPDAVIIRVWDTGEEIHLDPPHKTLERSH